MRLIAFYIAMAFGYSVQYIPENIWGSVLAFVSGYLAYCAYRLALSCGETE